MEDVAALEVPRLADVVDPGQQARVLAAQHALHLGGRPKVEEALLALRIGVARRVEHPLGRGQVLEHVIQRLLGDRPQVPRAEEVRARQRPCKERVVVEHLLEVRYQPARVDRVAVEATAGVVADAAGRHARQRVHRHGDAVRLGAPGTKQEVEKVRLGELGGAAEPAVGGVEGAPGGGYGVGEQPAVGKIEVAGCGLRFGGAAVEHCGELGACLRHLVPPRMVGVGRGGEHLPE